MSIERKNGGYLIATIHNGYRVHRFYIGYTRREAVALFRQYLRSL